MMTKTCPQCGCEVVNRNANAVYCCGKCQQAHNNAIWLIRKRINKRAQARLGQEHFARKESPDGKRTVSRVIRRAG